MRSCFCLLCLFISDTFSSVGDPLVQQVICAAGESVTFPTNVPFYGTISYKDNVIGQVFNEQSETNFSEMFMNRLRWLSPSGFFTLSDLRPEDSGRYTVQSTKNLTAKQHYQLEVYDKVSAPQVVSTMSNSSEFCSLLCSVRNMRGLELVWYEDGISLNRNSSSSASNITLKLQLEIKMMDKHNYSCVAFNPVSNQTTTVDITHCCAVNTGQARDDNQMIVTTVVVSVISVVAVIMMFVCLRRRKQRAASRRTEDRSATEGLNEEILYSGIIHKNPSQANLPESASGETCPLMTLYDQIRPERMVACDHSGTE